jgi:hypothetical protein
MPRFFFPCWDGDRLIPDDEGLDFEDLAQARTAATVSLGEMARDTLPRETKQRLLRVQVTDGEKQLVELRLTFEAVPG